MFDAKDKPIEGPGTVVGANVHLSGTLKDINDITVHGQVEGEIISDKNVIIAKSAIVKGPIKAKTVTISGKVHGEINALDKLELLETGEVSGSIATNDLMVKSGAILNGKCKMKQEVADKEKITKINPEKIESKSDKKNTDKKEPEINKDKKYELE